jgi:dihydrolipoamide dehydrogenase
MAERRECDVVVVGGGPAGYPAAIRAARLGADVMLIEEGRLGGTCLNVGCIPTKFYCRRSAAGTRSWPDVVADKDKLVDELVAGIEFLFQRRGVELVRGRGRPAGDREVVVEGDAKTVVRARKGILYAPGSVTLSLPAMPVDHRLVLESDDLVDSPLDFTSLVIVGGGAIGLEWATICRRRGVEVTVVEMMPQLLPGLDADVARRLAGLLKRNGIQVMVGAKVEHLGERGDGVAVHLADGRVLEAERALIAVGRQANVEEEELRAIGVECERRRVKTTPTMATTAESVWAAGDAAAGGPMLAHVATRQGLVAVQNMLGGLKEMDYDRVPWAVFSDPEAAGVGLNASQAGERGVAAREGKADYRALGRPRADGFVNGFFKVLAAEEDGKILGAHVVGHGAAEVVQIVSAAMACDATVTELGEFIAIHPTYAELVAEALEDWQGLATHKP